MTLPYVGEFYWVRLVSPFFLRDSRYPPLLNLGQRSRP